MAIQQLFRSSRSLLIAASIASAIPLMFGGAEAVAQTAKARNSDVKPLSNHENLPKVTLSGKRGAPSRRFGGGSRVGNGNGNGSRIQNVCAAGPQAIAMISPEDNVTVTTAEKPSLMLWVNESKYERDLELAVREGPEGNGEDVYLKMIKLSAKAGLVTLDMSEFEDAPSLTKGEDYYIYLSLICDASDRSKDMVVEGRLNPVDFDQWVAQDSQRLASNADWSILEPLFQVEQSVEVGLWHDAMVQLNHLRQEGSTSSIRKQAQQRWQALLEADTELNVIASETSNVVSPLAIADVQELDNYSF